MRCPKCGEDMARLEGETDEEYRRRWERDNCPDHEAGDA